MNKHIRPRRTPKQPPRHWGTTIFMGISAVLSWFFVYLAWQMLGHNVFITIAVTLFLLFFAIIFTIGAIDGRKRRYCDIVDDLLRMLPLWP